MFSVTFGQTMNLHQSVNQVKSQRNSKDSKVEFKVPTSASYIRSGKVW